MPIIAINRFCQMPFAAAFLVWLILLSLNVSASENEKFSPSAQIKGLLDTNCYSCHDSESMKGKIRLDNLEELSLQARLELLNKVQEQVFSSEMSPKEKLAISESDALLKWVSGELSAHSASKLEDKLPYYRYVNHQRLFSGEIKVLPFTPARRWRINELIYMELVNNVPIRESNELTRQDVVPSSMDTPIHPFISGLECPLYFF